MKVDVAVPSYKGLLHPRAKAAMDAMLDYSRCSCFQQHQVLASELYDCAAARRWPKRLPTPNPFHHPSNCHLGKHDIYVIPQASSCIITWSRNDLLVRRRKDADAVLFCDDDIVVPWDALERLLAHGKDIVAGLCTRRVDPPEPNFRAWSDEAQNYGVIEKWSGHGTLKQVGAIGTGLMLLSRRAIEDVAVAYHPNEYALSGNGFWFEFIRGPHGLEWGEDISYCFKASRIGHEIWVDTAVCPEHMGDFGFRIEDYLDHQEAVTKAGGLEPYRRGIIDRQIAEWKGAKAKVQSLDALAQGAD